jgi:hypothetical protein
LDARVFPVKKELSDQDNRNIIFLFAAVSGIIILLVIAYVLFQRFKK